MSEGRPGGTFQPGDILNNTYRIEAVLGRGGTSEVYRARSEISGRAVAIKVLRPEFSGNEDYLSLMRREEEVRDIRHDAVVRYSENHRLPDGQVYLVMDYVDGPALEQKMRAGGMSAQELLTVCARVAEGLHAAHSRNIVHRDLSPDNIILRGGRPDEAVIIDFGIAKDTNQGAATIVGGEFAGKYAYAAPEQLNGIADTRTDIYSLGALLLATFRGKSPDVGRNPMEVIQYKARPLDTEGVPEPLRSLIDKMTQADPGKRFQSAQELLNEIDPAFQQTVVPSRPSSVTPKPKAATPEPAKEKKKGGILVPLLVVLVLAGGGAGVWFSGLIPMGTQAFDGESYPTADPYTLIVEARAEAPPRMVGYAPSTAGAAALRQAVDAKGGSAELILASSDAIAPGWAAGMAGLVTAASALDEWRLTARANEVRLTGKTAEAAVRDRVLASVTGAATPEGLTVSADIRVEDPVPPVTPETLRPLLEDAADCGPLTLVGAPNGPYPRGAAIVVEGQVADIATRQRLENAITPVAPGHPVEIRAEVLNPSLCLIEAELPQAPSGGFKIDFSYGDRTAINPDGRYLVGDNPVIDIVIPTQVNDGYMWVSILDVSGNVYHLLPNLNRQDNSVEALRNGLTGPVSIRVAYPANDTDGGKRLAFLVDDTTLGKSKIVVLHSQNPLFEELRPSTESAGAFADALGFRRVAGIQSLDSRILTTSKP